MLVQGLEDILNYRIKNPKIFMEALTHCSWQESDPPCYQRLEYLGDAVLDILVTQHMYELYGHTNPGVLTNLRQATVNNERLAIAAVKFNIQKFLLHHSAYLQAHISDFVDQVTKQICRLGLQGPPIHVLKLIFSYHGSPKLVITDSSNIGYKVLSSLISLNPFGMV